MAAMSAFRTLAAVVFVLAVAGCATAPPVARPDATAGGGYYLDDGPGANPPANLDAVPDAVPRREPLHRFANRTYAVLGNTYTPLSSVGGYHAEGVATWYGRRFHGKPTASGEPYDMYAMTAAHPTLPIPSYARVTALDSGRSAVVRINDRGPFHKSRLIDVSYAAAHKLGFVARGSTRVRVESLDPDAWNTRGETPSQGVFLQLGAFSRADGAQQLLARLARRLAVEPGRTRIVARDGLHRVQLGPYPSEDEALAERARVRERLEIEAVLVRRDG
jgi:rare lipoprotein A